MELFGRHAAACMYFMIMFLGPPPKYSERGNADYTYIVGSFYMIFEADNKVLRQQKVQFNVVPLKLPKLSNAKYYYFGLLH